MNTVSSYMPANKITQLGSTVFSGTIGTHMSPHVILCLASAAAEAYVKIISSRWQGVLSLNQVLVLKEVYQPYYMVA